MDHECVRFTVDDAGVAEVVLDRSEKLNALNAQMFAALADVLQRLRELPSLRAVVLRGEGKAFCAGLDKSSFDRMAQGSEADGLSDLVARTHGVANLPQHVAWGWRELPVPVIAAAHGVAFGGGLQIALGADIRLVTPDLQMSVMEIRWGLVPDMGGCVLMNQLAKADVVRELTFSGRIFSGAEALTLGLATRVCEDPVEQARALARQISCWNPDTMRANKRLLNLALDAQPADVLLAESRVQQCLIGSPNQQESVSAAVEKRPGRFADPSPGE